MISVVMPVFNAAPYVAQAVHSVLAQTHAGLELLALDDGSTDASPAILDNLARRDPRLRVLHQPNAGAVAALNRGLDEALRTPAQFVAIMHADDLCLPTRLQRQIDYFAEHPAVALCGTWIATFGGAAPREWRYPQDPRFTKPSLLFWCCFAHPTIMFRRHVLEAGLRYDPLMPMPCEDYALWAEAARKYELGNVGEVLLKYREHPDQGGALHQRKTAALTAEIRRRQIARLGIVPTPREMTLQQRLADSDFPGTRAFVQQTRAWLERLREANTRTHIYDPDALAKILAGRWAAACMSAASHGADSIWPEFWQSPLAHFVDRTLEKNHLIPNP